MKGAVAGLVLPGDLTPVAILATITKSEVVPEALALVGAAMNA